MKGGTSFKIMCLGDGGVGKTASVIMFCSSYYVEEYDPTIEDSYRKQKVIDDESCLLGRKEYMFAIVLISPVL